MSKAKLQRLDGSENLTANIGYEGVEVVQNDFDNKYPWNSITVVEDNGEKWIRIPTFYTWYEVVDGVVKGRKISQYKIDDDWFLNPLFLKDDRILPYVDIAAYLMSYVDGNAHSRTGDTPLSYVSPSVARGYANACSNESYDVFLFDIWALQMLQDLFSIEFATTDCQSIMAGYYPNQSMLSNGTTDSVEYVSGCNTANGAEKGVECIKYRGIENVWGNGILFVDGIRSNSASVLISPNPMLHGEQSDYIVSTIEKLNESGVVYQLGYDSINHLVFPINTDVDGGYKNTYSSYNGKGISGCYCGIRSTNIGLWSYDMSTGYNDKILSSVFRMVRRSK